MVFLLKSFLMHYNSRG